MSDTPPGNVREPKTADALGRAKQAVAKAGS
jgi:hypothetical protein